MATLTFRAAVVDEKLAGRALTLWLKRVRKAGYRVRYLAAMEVQPRRAAETGFHVKHWHVLMCVYSGGALRGLRKAWHGGFAHTRLVRDEAGVAYVCKYIGKGDLAPRIRASGRFGEGPPAAWHKDAAAEQCGPSPPARVIPARGAP
jgi:hypothetical protein